MNYDTRLKPYISTCRELTEEWYDLGRPVNYYPLNSSYEKLIKKFKEIYKNAKGVNIKDGIIDINQNTSIQHNINIVIDATDTSIIHAINKHKNDKKAIEEILHNTPFIKITWS